MRLLPIGKMRMAKKPGKPEYENGSATLMLKGEVQFPIQQPGVCTRDV
jgi:hypothetical protein